MLSSGLGLYPSDECYDPSRSGWLPYWFNSSTERDCILAKAVGMYPGVDYKTEYPSPPPPPAVGVPPIGYQTTEQGGSNVSPEEAQRIQNQTIADQTAAWKKQMSDFFAALAGKVDERTTQCAWYQTRSAVGKCELGGTLLWAVAIGGVGLLIYMKR